METLDSSPSFSLLNKASAKQVVLKPFPYLVIEDALEESLYRQIEEGYPDFLKENPAFKKWNNKRVQIYGSDFVKNSKHSTLLRSFVNYHLSQKFYLEVCELFSEAISQYYPELEKKIGKKIEDIKVAVRTQEATDVELFLDCQIGINTPVSKKTSVRGAHLDDVKKFFVGLFYLRQDEDISEGGDLLLYKVKKDYPLLDSDPNWGSNVVQDFSKIEAVAKVPYQRNVFIIFLNTKDSFHGVSEREETPYPRRLINVIGDFSKDIGLYGL
ncbi:hypothetical protein AB751O23_AQ_00190 [Chlamydiales bacterium SCGC AB-751-O23]|nr:hypothetical protein AB751O23_AQ_00190 [Chlamydiales bacterium SCGC AB-751-O23]